jgi:phosphatidate cytidylyltransferase
MRTRIITAIVTLPILILPIFFGGISLFAFVWLLCAIGLYEFMKSYEVDFIGHLFIQIANGVYYVTLYIFGTSHLNGFIAFFMISLLLCFVLWFPNYDFKKISIMIAGFFYVTFFLSYIVLVRQVEIYGIWFVWLIFLLAFGSDSFAYFAGRAFGKHKLAKELSPKKTIEGAIGGVLGAVVLTVGYGYYLFTQGIIDDLSKLISFAVLGVVGSVFSQIGDLVASAIKRQTGIKDFGSILPGHGGVMDRFDSNIMTAPFVYYIMMLLILK